MISWLLLTSLSRAQVNGATYLTLLKRRLWPLLNELNEINEMIFMQDRALPHYATGVREWLDRKFPNRWMGRAGPIRWPARSPDLTPMDFWLWGGT